MVHYFLVSEILKAAPLLCSLLLPAVKSHVNMITVDGINYGPVI